MKIKSFVSDFNSNTVCRDGCYVVTKENAAAWEGFLGRKVEVGEKVKFTELLDSEVNQWLERQKGIQIFDIRHSWLGEYIGTNFHGAPMACVTTVIYEESPSPSARRRSGRSMTR